MRYISNFRKETTCDHCGRGISNVVVFLNEQGQRIEVGVDCAASLVKTSKNVMSRWIKTEQEKIDSAARFFENEKPVLTEREGGKYVFTPSDQDAYTNRSNRRTFSEGFIQANFPQYA